MRHAQARLLHMDAGKQSTYKLTLIYGKVHMDTTMGMNF
jgi:hypothetical protein